MKQFRLWLSIFAIAIFAVSCNKGCGKNRFSVSSDKSKIELNFKRLDRDLFENDGLKPHEKIEKIKKLYPNFYREYFRNIIMLGDPDDPAFNVPLAGFLADAYIERLYADANAKYGDLEKVREDLTKAFGIYHYFLPERPIPSIIFCISALNYSVAATDSVLAIGLDMYLGPEHEAYLALGFPDYIRFRKDAQYLAAEAAKGWLMTEFPKNNKKIALVDEMVYQGKIMFLLGIMFPDTKDEYLFGYTEKNVQFLKSEEGNMWAYFIEQKLLFNEEKREIMKYTEEAPFSIGMPREAPGRTGIYIGRQIVKSYMENNEKVTVQELMENDDYQSIFTQSKYKPKK